MFDRNICNKNSVKTMIRQNENVYLFKFNDSKLINNEFRHINYMCDVWFADLLKVYVTFGWSNNNRT